jgi:CMP-N-acetylneuraminic acid synthetase
MKLDGDGLISPQFDIEQSVIWSNRQELPTMYRFNGGIIAGKVRHVLENTEYNIGYDTNLKIKPIFMSKEESVDIDDPIDLELCRLMAGDYDK